jgi:hypothetical protein
MTIKQIDSISTALRTDRLMKLTTYEFDNMEQVTKYFHSLDPARVDVFEFRWGYVAYRYIFENRLGNYNIDFIITRYKYNKRTKE